MIQECIIQPRCTDKTGDREKYLEKVFLFVKAEVSEKMDLRRDLNDGEVMDIIEAIVLTLPYEYYISLEERGYIGERVFNAIRRFDVIQPLIDDTGISEIMINGHRNIFIERNGRMIKTDFVFENESKLEDVIQNIVSKVNRTVNEAQPIVDARLEDGSRVNVVLRPVALDGPVITIRKFPEKPMSVERLLNFNSLNQDMAAMLRLLIQAKYNIFISGGTGSGKTSLLNAVANLIPQEERVITIEDSAELQLKSLKNIVRLETRNANTEGKGQINMGNLIKTSLRMRPDRIIVGEVRDGPAAYYMLQSMNTGHDGSLTTGHANSARDMLSRLETMVLSEELMPLEVIRKQIESAIDIIIHMSRLRDGSRKIVEISELSGLNNGNIVLNPLFVFQEHATQERNDEKNVAEKVCMGVGRTCNNKVEGRVTGEFCYTGNQVRNNAKILRSGFQSIYFASGDAEISEIAGGSQ